MNDLLFRTKIIGILTCLEAQGVFLSSHGNHAASNDHYTLEVYKMLKAENECMDFDLSKIRAAMVLIPRFFEKHRTFCRHALSNTVKQDLEHCCGPDRLHDGAISNGDFIIAMILLGYSFTFSGQFNCAFRIEYRNDTE